MITAEQAKELLDAATRGPWRLDPKDPTLVRFPSTVDWTSYPLDPEPVSVRDHVADMALVAAAPDLAKAVIDLSAQLSAARSALTRMDVAGVATALGEHQ
jgi:hypothetical protein